MRAAWFYLRRDRAFRPGAVVLQSFAVALGLAALVALELFSGRIERTIGADTKKLLAADVQLQAWREIDPAVLSAVTDLAAPAGVIRQTDFVATLVLHPGGASGGGAGEKEEAVTVSARALEGAYPYYGTFRTEPQVSIESLAESPPESRPDGQNPGILLDASFRARDVKEGDLVGLGAERFRVRGFVVEEPQTVASAFAFGPRVIVHQSSALKTGLLTATSRAFRMLLIRTDRPYAEFARAFRARVPDAHWRLISPERANRQAARVIDRISGFLSLVALVAVFLGGTGLFMIFRARALMRLPQFLTLRCLGLSSRELIAATLVQGVSVAVLGWLFGLTLGIGLEHFIGSTASGLLGVTLAGAVYRGPILRALAVAVLMVLLAVLLPLLQALRVPVNAAFRESDGEGLRMSGFDVGGIGLLAVVLSGLVGRDPKLTFFFLLGLAAVVLLLWGLAWLVAKIGERLRIESPLALRHAFLSFSRQGAATQVLVVALGLSAFLPSTVFLLSRTLRDQIDLSYRIGLPNLFLLGVAPESSEALAKLLPDVHYIAVTQVRLMSVKGVPIEELREAPPWSRLLSPGAFGQDRTESEGNDRGGDEASDPDRDFERLRFTREYFTTRRATLDEGEKLAEGQKIFRDDPIAGGVRVSVEARFAAQLGVRPGDTFEIQMAGVRLPARVDSLRTVDWFNFRPNFFLVFHPDDVQGAPFEYVGVAQVPAGQVPQWQRKVIEKFPGVTALDAESIALRLRGLLDRLATAIYAVGSFSVLSAGLVFLGIVLARRTSRLKEMALWKCLGLGARQLERLMVLEIALLSLVTGALSVLTSIGFSWLVATGVLDIPLVMGRSVPVLVLTLVVALPVVLSLLGWALIRPLRKISAAQVFQSAEEA